jgi:oligopeptide/dipeptide ABC transporter ATP-binding protein
MSTSMGDLLRVRDLSISFADESGHHSVPVVTDLNLTVGRGQAVGIVGESGSGKTMTVRAILGLLPRAAKRVQGSVWFDGLELTGLKPRQLEDVRGSAIGYIPQDPLAALNPLLTIADQITEGSRLHSQRGHRLTREVREVLRGYGLKTGERAVREQAGEMLKRVGVEDGLVRAAQFPDQFSGGMRQRAIIASALQLRPTLILADEPTTALDATVERQVLDLLRQLKNEYGMTLLLVSHDLNVVSWNCDYAYVMYAGRLAEEGRVEDLFQRPRHPYTRSLVLATPTLDRPPRPSGSETSISASDSQPLGCPYVRRCPRPVDSCRERFPDRATDEDEHGFWCFNPMGRLS